MIKDILHLGSQSYSRQKLLTAATIPFVVLPHASDEQLIRGEQSFDLYVKAIAQEKMRCLMLPEQPPQGKSYIFVLTADTLVHAVDSGEILTKPKDLDDAKNILRRMRGKKAEVVTGCCLQKLSYESGRWDVIVETTWTTGAFVEFWVDDEDFDAYFAHAPKAMVASGAAIVEDYGQLFLKTINGSYSAVIGLPLFELRCALKKMGFVF